MGEHALDVIERLRKAGKTLDALRERLTIRFGRDASVVTPFAAADEALLSLFRAVTLPAKLPNTTPSRFGTKPRTAWSASCRSREPSKTRPWRWWARGE